MSLDYRDVLIMKRVSQIDKVILVAGGKGGVGKSVVAATTALLLSKKFRTGLLDLDLHGPSSAAILGAENSPIEEADGIVPPTVDRLKLMSLDLLVKGRPIPLSGLSKQEVVKEIVALTDFGELDFLVVDLPPGSGDELLASIRIFRPKATTIIVTTPSALSSSFAERVITIMKSTSVPIFGIVENMSRKSDDSPTLELCQRTGVTFLGRLPFDEIIARAGNITRDQLISSRFASSLQSILNMTGLYR
ncbi:MAG: P-loop NTPase [Candidatus Caldarchaeum sp.]